MALSSLTPPFTWKLFLKNNTILEALSNLSTHIDRDYSLDKTDCSTGNLVLLGILTGAAYFTVDLSRKLKLTHQVNFLRVSSYHDSQTASDKVEITGLSSKELDNLSNKHIIVLDELYDSGRTLHEVTSYLKQFNPLSIKTCVIFRKSKKIDNLPKEIVTTDINSKVSFTHVETYSRSPDYCGIDNLPDVWYVGYGLDDCGTKREYTDLYAVPKSMGIPTNSDDPLFNDEIIFQVLLGQVKLIPPVESQ